MLSSPSLPSHHAHALNPTSHRRPANPSPFPPLPIPSSTNPRRLRARADRIGVSMRSPVSGSETARRSPADATETTMKVSDGEMDRVLAVGNKAADVAGEVLRKYFRQRFDIIDKEDLSPVTIADREAEESMASIILESFPSHAVFGEEHVGGVRRILLIMYGFWTQLMGLKASLPENPYLVLLLLFSIRENRLLGLLISQY